MTEPMAYEPIPCPSFQTVGLQITEVCSCDGTEWMGNPDCPIHGERVIGYRQGWNAAFGVITEAQNQETTR